MERKYKHAMMDWETMGKRANCIVASLGVCAFDLDMGVGPVFYAVIDRSAEAQPGRTITPSTVEWWAQQSPEARAVLDQPGVAVPAVMAGLEDFVAAATVGRGDVRVWGNGADFDNAILKDLYEDHGRELPYYFRNSRCFRTLIDSDEEGYRMAKAQVSRGTHHNALDDARWQASVAVRLLRRQAAMRRMADHARTTYELLTAQGRLRGEQRNVSNQLNAAQEDTLTALREYEQPMPQRSLAQEA